MHLFQCKATWREQGEPCRRDGIERGCVAEVKNVFKGVGELLSLASANAFKGDAVSTVRCLPRNFLEHAPTQLAKLRVAVPQGALRSFNMTSEDPAACPALLCKSRPAAVAACNAYRVSASCMQAQAAIIGCRHTASFIMCSCPSIMGDSLCVHSYNAP